MATDIYGRAGQDFGGAIAADAAKVIFAGQDLDGSGVGMLVQSLKVGYQQQITRVYEIGSDKTFYVVGRTQGQVDMGRIMGPRLVQLAFYTKFGDACQAVSNNINFMVEARCSTVNGTAIASLQDSGTAYSFTIKAAVIINMGIQVGAQDMVINEQIQMMFTALNAGFNNV